MKAITYSLFGIDKQFKNSFSFASYLRGLLLNIRVNRLIYPDWKTVLETDKETYQGYKGLFDRLQDSGALVVETNPPEPLTKAMLWRLKPVFNWDKYTHVLCRDLDGVSTYREAQCVQEWLNSGKAAHAMTDSISHDVYMMGGMIGFTTADWTPRTGFNYWHEMFNGLDLNFNEKGMDQRFLTRHIYPKYGNRDAPSIIQHYLLGIGNTFLDGWRPQIPDIDLPGVDASMKDDSNATSEHIGAAGWNNVPLFAFLRKHKERFEDITNIERSYQDIAYWIKDKTFD